VEQKYPPTIPPQTISLWFQLFSDILDDEQLTKELWNKLNGTLEIEENLEELIFSHLPERNTGRIQRRKKKYGREFRLNTHIDGYEINDIML
jgi:hypothetical protein